ncbi:MAG: hypothetical protein GY722_27360 [bacterium]|nr:hypothetical protein [bacterium]
MRPPDRLNSDLLPLLARLRQLVETPDAITTADTIRRRLDEPLRVAIAGRVKAGKSTLLNALVGERLAPTDAGECTKVVTWYRHGTGYDVTAMTEDGDQVPVPFTRERDRLVMDVAGLDLARVTRLEVTWPAARLRRFTLIDTPGLEAHDEASAARSRTLLGITDDDHSDVDAVVYLMRHAHRLDMEFLEAFSDHSLAHPSPVNAIAVLSRADEIGAGRRDALDSAAAIAGRYARDARIRTLCATVVPVAGLIAETGRTLQESEGGSLRALADLPHDEIQPMSLSVDRFADPNRSPLDSDTRRQLLLRLGLFGVRFGIARLQQRGATTSDLARDLVAASGLDELAALIDNHFGRRAELLKTRSAIVNLKTLAGSLPSSDEATEIGTEIERLEAAAPELGELRLLHLVISGAAGLTEEESAEVDRLVSDDSYQFRLGMPDEAIPEELQAVIVTRLGDWRRKAAYPLASAERREACELVATTYERLHAELATA